MYLEPPGILSVFTIVQPNWSVVDQLRSSLPLMESNDSPSFKEYTNSLAFRLNAKKNNKAGCKNLYNFINQ